MLGLPRIKTGMSIACDASPRVWITGNLGGAFFFKPVELGPQACQLILGLVGQLGLDRLKLVACHLQFQAIGFPLQESVDLLVLGLDRGLGRFVRVDLSLGTAGTSTYSVLANTPSSA